MSLTHFIYHFLKSLASQSWTSFVHSLILLVDVLHPGGLSVEAALYIFLDLLSCFDNFLIVRRESVVLSRSFSRRVSFLFQVDLNPSYE